MQNKIVNSPELIWLVYGDLDGLGDVDHHKCHEVTWCQDKINQTDIEYVRADKIAELQVSLAVSQREAADWKQELEAYKATENARISELQAEDERMFVALHEDCCKDFVNCNKGCEHLVKQLRADIASRQSWQVGMCDAAQALLDEQQGPPLLRNAASWGKAVRQVESLIYQVRNGDPEFQPLDANGRPAPADDVPAPTVDRYLPDIYVKSSGYTYGARMTLDPCGHYVEHADYLRLAAKLVEAQKVVDVVFLAAMSGKLPNSVADALHAVMPPAPLGGEQS